MKRALAAALAALLAGCAHQQIVETKVAIPVECREKVPSRPAMPSDSIAEGSTLTQQVNALLAEIEIRNGYELRLVTALQACTRPIGTQR